MLAGFEFLFSTWLFTNYNFKEYNSLEKMNYIPIGLMKEKAAKIIDAQSVKILFQIKLI